MAADDHGDTSTILGQHGGKRTKKSSSPGKKQKQKERDKRFRRQSEHTSGTIGSGRRSIICDTYNRACGWQPLRVCCSAYSHEQHIGTH